MEITNKKEIIHLKEKKLTNVIALSTCPDETLYDY